MSSKIEYRIDSRDRLIRVDEAWREFAESNRAEHLANNGIIGTSLWDLIRDPETRELFTPLLSKVRERGQPLSVPLRCDSPELRRYLRLTLSPLPDGGVRFVSETVRTEARSPVPLLNENSSRTEELLFICSWCKRVEVPGGWTEVELAAAILGLFDEAPLPRLSHSICPDCRTVVEQDLTA